MLIAVFRVAARRLRALHQLRLNVPQGEALERTAAAKLHYGCLASTSVSPTSDLRVDPVETLL
ncbi:MAG: hypothetical protein M3O31_08765, partial [Acidobacteriota bacterium]|nr:hypothetical protein [Acidobacteriota bacterium]